MEGEANSSNGAEKNNVTSGEKVSPEDLVAQGRREAACGKYQEAATLFEEACSELATKHDQMADEMAEPYFLYGKALLEIARQEADFLGTAVPENDAESNEESDGDEEKVGESSSAGGPEAGGSGAEQPPAGTEPTKEEQGEPPKGGEAQEKKEEDQGMDVDEPAAGTTEEKQAGSSSKEPTADSEEKQVGNSSGDVDEVKGEVEEDAEGDTEDVPTLQLAWEVLELSRIIYDKEADKNPSRLAEIHLLLGEINMESDHQEEAVEEFRSALRIRESLLTPEDRRIAECHFQLGMAHTFAKEFDKAIESYEFAKSVLKKKLESLTTDGEDGEQAKAEVKEISELLPDLDSKIEDVVEMKKLAAEQADTKQESSSGFDAPQLKGDAKPLQIAVRRGKQSPAKDVIKMIRKRGSIGKIEPNATTECGEDESAAKRLKSDDADKTDDTTANEQ